MEVVLEYGVVERRKEQVIKKQELDFSNLYSGLNNTDDFDPAYNVLSVQVKDNLEVVMGRGEQKRITN